MVIKTDRRRAPRFRIEQCIELRFNRETFIPATGINMNEYGVMTETDRIISPGTLIYLLIELPIDGQKKFIEIEGVVIWSAEEGESHHTGIKFTDLTLENKKYLLKYLKSMPD